MNEVTKIRQVGLGTQESVPHNVEAEQQLLGAILTNNDVFDRIAALVSATDFYDPVHARIFEVRAADTAISFHGAKQLNLGLGRHELTDLSLFGRTMSRP